MTYDEFQVYFHAFNNTYSALGNVLSNDSVKKPSVLDAMREEADRVATMLTDKYKTVDKPVVPDLTSAVETAFKNFGKGTKK